MTTPQDFSNQSMLPPEDEVELLDYIELLVRQRWLIFWTAALCVLGSIGYVLQQTEVYPAEAIILPADTHDYLDLDGLPQRPSRQSFYLDILQSTAISRRVLEQDYEYTLEGVERRGNLLDFFELESMHRGFEALGAITEFDAERTGVITISVETLSSRLSAEVANEYVAQLSAYNQRTRRTRLDSQLVFMNQRLSEIRGQLDSLHQELVGFQRRNRDMLPDTREVRATDSALEYERRRNEIEILSSLYSTVLNQHEIARVEAKKELPDFEILALAEPPEFGSRTSLKKAGTISLAVSLMLSVFLAFIVEYIGRNRKSGRLDPIFDEFRKDGDRLRRLFGDR